MHKSNILIISNGYGEDQIACNLIKAFQSLNEASTQIYPLPLVGAGLEYQKIKLTPLIKNPILPSGGFIRNLKILFTDLYHGLLQNTWLQLKTIHKYSQKTNLTIAVGDVFCLVMAKLFNPNPVYFLPTAKSDLFAKHSFIEKFLIKKLAAKTFTRDQITANALNKAHIKAFYLGNPMMDNMQFNKDTFNYLKTDQILGLLPGSRAEAYPNLLHILKIIEILHTKNPQIKYILCKSAHLSYAGLTQHLHNSKWQLKKTNHQYTLNHKSQNLKIIITDQFYDFLYASKIILGLAGTANEQAIHFGKKVYCFEGFGPQSTAQRFQEQKKLLGQNLVFLPNHQPASMAQKLLIAFQQPAFKLSGKPDSTHSASHKIIRAILN